MGGYAFSAAIIIDEDNKYIPTSLGDGTLTEGTYDDAVALIAHANTVMQGVSANFSVTLGGDGHVTIAHTSTFSLLWKTDNPHGSDYDDDHAGTVIGFSDAADDTGANSYKSDWMAQGMFIPDDNPTYDSEDRLEKIGPPTFRSISGRTSRTVLSTQTSREMRFNAIHEDLFLNAHSSIRGTFQEWWQYASSGYHFVIYTDCDDYSGSDQGSYGLIVEQNASMQRGFPRLSPGNPYFSASIYMIKQP